MTEDQFVVGKALSGNIVLCDYELFMNKKTEFIYVAMEDFHAFGISQDYLN